ncbi:MAG: N-acetyltransferase family protein [Vicinamibacterales bacterium]
MALLIRLAQASDLPAINEIYNHYVVESTCTYQETPEPAEGRLAWFERHGARHPVIVAERNGMVAGWGSLSPFHARSAYRFTVENSVYVHHAQHRQGIGDALLGDLVTRASTLGHRSIIAGIDSDQPASIAIHARHGFIKVGHLQRVGYKFDRWLDVIYMQLTIASLDEGSNIPPRELR